MICINISRNKKRKNFFLFEIKYLKSNVLLLCFENKNGNVPRFKVKFFTTKKNHSYVKIKKNFIQEFGKVKSIKMEEF